MTKMFAVLGAFYMWFALLDFAYGASVALRGRHPSECWQLATAAGYYLFHEAGE